MRPKIDIVIPWVDGSDEKWLKEKFMYSEGSEVPDEKIADAAKCFRDWGLLKYWFRGIEKFAPWVRKVHFVTYGHLPEWLNTENPKLHIVKHTDFMPEGSLPTYNSRALELNIHRIPGLAEHFVYFNDDTYLVKKTKASDFFKRGLPRDYAILSPVNPNRFGTGAVQIYDLEIVNDHFGGFDAFKKNKKKWLSPVYGVQLFRTILMLPFKKVFGFYERHLPNSYRKSTYEEVWRAEPEVLMATTRSRFKKKDNVNQWIMRYWQLASGKFIPRSPNIGYSYYSRTKKDLDDACNAIIQQKKKIICINDDKGIEDVSLCSKRLSKAFTTILPEKSSFEK